jgi:hypothetical protein
MAGRGAGVPWLTHTHAPRASTHTRTHACARPPTPPQILSAHYISSLMLSRNRMSLNKIAEDSTFKVRRGVWDVEAQRKGVSDCEYQEPASLLTKA